MSTPQTPQVLTGTLALVEASDPLRGLVTDQALDPEEVKRLTVECGVIRGRVIEASGRRILAYFANPADALHFAQSAQKVAGDVRQRNPKRHSLAVRVILGYGRLVAEGDRVRGDWPHRLAGLISRVPVHCVAGIKSYVDQLPPGALPTVPRLLVDDLYLLQAADTAAVETQLASPLAVSDAAMFTAITLKLRGTPLVFRASDCPILIGRDARCAVRLSSETASRVHGRVDYQQGKFYYVDDSRNGSWVLIGSGEEIKLLKDRTVLAGEGAISPGAPISQQTGEVVRFECHSTKLAMPQGSTEGDTRRL
jgi:pSer/pThr/pTyr-binding forkhead associated (FHA) protein